MSRDEATRRADSALTRDTTHDGYVLVFSHAQGGIAPLVLPSSGEAMIGRDAPASLVIAHDSVSRRHARVHGGSPPLIEDLGSTNGTKVMGRPLATGERAPLTHGLVVEIGSVVAFVQPAAPSESSTLPSVQAAPPNETVARMTVAPPAMGSGGAAKLAPARPSVLRDATMHRLYALVDVVAPSKLSVLFLGETGVGKEVAAEAVHAPSPRA